MSTLEASTLVIIPTYNEIENLPLITGRVRAAVPEVHILIVDDNSPDGTGDKADEFAAQDDHIHVLHREGKGGLLGAYIAGFELGLERDYQVLCEMDADGSHAPEQLHLLLEEVDKGADLVIGSRYIPGGETVNWPASREYLSRLGNIYISVALGAGLSDMTAGYRAFRRELLESIDFDELSKAGYIFQVDLAFRAVKAGFDVREVPITFTEREYGESKLDGSFVKDSLLEVTKWGVAHRTEQLQDFGGAVSKLVNREVKDGSIIMRLLRPVHFAASYLFTELGSKWLIFVSVGLPFLSVIVLMKILSGQGIVEVLGLTVLYLFSLTLAYLINFFFNICFGFSAFVFKNLWGSNLLKTSLVAFMSGSLIPLAFFPKIVSDILSFLPFSSLIYTPVMIIVGKYDASQILQALALQFFWLLVMVGVSQLIWKRVQSFITIQGG